MFFRKYTLCIKAVALLCLTTPLHAQKAERPSWRINAGIGYGTYFGDVSHYRIRNFDDWKNVKHFLNYNKNYVESPSFHLSLEKKFSNRSGVLFSGNYTDIAMGDRYLSSDGKLLASSPNFNRALNFRSKIYDVGVGYKLKSNEKAFLAPYVWLGAGLSFFSTYGDLYDASVAAYDYASPTVATDGVYETDLRNLQTETDAKYRNMVPYANAGLGLAVKLSHAFAIGVESDIKYAFSDYIDDVSGTYKSSYATPQQAYAAKPGTNVIDPANPARGTDDRVNDFYIQNRLVLKNNFFAASTKKKTARGAFNAPYIYPPYYADYAADSLRNVDTASNGKSPDSSLSNPVLVAKTARVDSVLKSQDSTLSKLDNHFDSLSKRVDTLDQKLRGMEQKERVDEVNIKIYYLQELIAAGDRKPRRTVSDSLRRHIYQLQADSIKADAVRNGIEGSRLRNVSASAKAANEAAYDNTNVAKAAADTMQIAAPQEQNELLMSRNKAGADSLSRVYNRRADSVQRKLDSLQRLQQSMAADSTASTRTNRTSEKDTMVVTRTVTVKDTISGQRLEALNDKLQRAYNSNDSLRSQLDYLLLERDATQIQITNDSLRLQALRQQQSVVGSTSPAQPKRKWYEVFKKKKKENVTTEQQDRTALQINGLERELNDLNNRNAALERQIQNAPRVERYYETSRDDNKAERRYYADLQDELRQLNRQLGRERLYATPVTPVQPADNGELQREIDQLRNELQQLRNTPVNNAPLPPVVPATQPDSNAAKLDEVTRALDSLNRELATLKQQTAQPAPAKPVASTTSVYFNSGAVVASPAQRTKLAGLRTVIRENNNVAVQLKAFTDATGNMQVNEALSRKRAAYVKNYLVQHYGIPADAITVELNPSNKAAGGIPNPLDRRVDVVITTQQL